MTGNQINQAGRKSPVHLVKHATKKQIQLMSYKKQLKTDYRRKTRRMSELIGDGNRSLTSREREEFASLKRDGDSISNKLDTLNVPDYRGLTGGSNSGRQAWKDDKRTE